MAASNKKITTSNVAQHKPLVQFVTDKNHLSTCGNKNDSYSDLLPSTKHIFEWCSSDEESSSKSSSKNNSPHGSQNVSLDLDPLDPNMCSTPNISLQQVDITYSSLLDHSPILPDLSSNFALKNSCQNGTSQTSMDVVLKQDT